MEGLLAAPLRVGGRCAALEAREERRAVRLPSGAVVVGAHDLGDEEEDAQLASAADDVAAPPCFEQLRGHRVGGEPTRFVSCTGRQSVRFGKT